MNELNIGETVLVIADVPTFTCHTGRIVSIAEPFVRDEAMKNKALREMPLYRVRLDDGRSFRFRGRDLLVKQSRLEPRVREAAEVKSTSECSNQHSNER